MKTLLSIFTAAGAALLVAGPAAAQSPDVQTPDHVGDGMARIGVASTRARAERVERAFAAQTGTTVRFVSLYAAPGARGDRLCGVAVDGRDRLFKLTVAGATGEHPQFTTEAAPSTRYGLSLALYEAQQPCATQGDPIALVSGGEPTDHWRLR